MLEKPAYPINYELSFLLFWGPMLALSVFGGGLLMFAFTMLAIMVLIHHEHAHVKECIKRGVKVNSVTFNWMGGGVNADIYYANDAVPILSAGLINTGCYAFAAVALLASVQYLGRNVWTGFNFANNPYLQFLTSVSVFLSVLFFSNILPISIHSKEHGIVRTDGWGAYKFRILRDELWNDAKNIANEWEIEETQRLKSALITPDTNSG
jgi:hypothetical protein